MDVLLLNRGRRIYSRLILTFALVAGCALESFSATLPPGVTLYSATFGAGTFVGVGANGAIFSSINGGPWQQRVSGTTNRLEAVGFGAGVFVAAGENGTLLSSSDGVNWTVRSISAVITTPHVAYGNGKFVVGGKGPTGLWTMLVSSNGVNWATINLEAAGPASVPNGLPFGGITFGAGRFLAVGGVFRGASLFLTSTNGVNWKEQGSTLPSAAGPGPITYGNGTFALIEHYYFEDDDDDSGFLDRVLISEDGNEWQHSAFSSADWNAVAAGGCTFVLAGNDGFSGTKVWTSDHGEYWTPLPSITNAINALAYGSGKFFAVGDDILELPVPAASPFIPISPTNQVVTAGPYPYAYFNAGLSCLEPPVYYQWRREGVDIPGATNRYYSLVPAIASDAGNYTMVASNAAGQRATSVVSTLIFQLPPDVPASIYWPTTPNTNTVPVGVDTSIGIGVTGWPTPSYQWRFNGVDLPGQTNSTLPIINPNTAAEGVYTVVVSNALGSAVSLGTTLRLQREPPATYSYPQDFTAPEGSRLALMGQYGPLFYPYYMALIDVHILHGGISQRVPLTRDLNLIFHEISLADAGTYTLAISNAYGMATGLVANVTVTPAGPLDRWMQRNPLPQNDNLFDVTYGNGQFIAVGDRGSIVHSVNSVDWTATPLKTETLLSGVTFANDLFVAVGGPNILISSNGLNWTAPVVRLDLALESVVFGNGRFVAAGGDTILTSTDGVTWTNASLPPYANRSFRHLAFGNGTFVGVGYVGQGPSIWTSSDGTSWLIVTNGPRDEFESVTFGNGQFIAVGDDGVLYTSPNGAAWTARDSNVGSRLLGVAHGNGRYVAVGARGRVVSSANGINWTRETSGTPDRLESVRFINDRFVAVGENGTMLTSANGTTWTKRSQGSTRDLDGIASGNGLIVIAGKGGAILTSINGTQFTQQNSGVTNDLHGIGWADGLFVAVGEPEIILASSNAINWQIRHSGTVSSLKNVRKGSNLWVAVGTEGTILTSPNGLTWTPRTSTTCNDLNDVVYGNGRYVVVGDNLPPNGTMLISSDGIEWTRHHQYIGKNLRSVNYANNTFIATANDETFIVSSNGLDWEVRTTGLYPGYGYNLRAANYAAGTWIMVGNEGTILTSSNALNWTRRAIRTSENLHGIVYLNGQFVTMGNRGTILQSASLKSRPWLAGQLTPSGFEVTVHGEVGTYYELRATPSLSATNWTLVQGFTLAQPTTNILDVPLVSPGQRFYRVIIP